MVQDIYPHKLHNEFDPEVKATENDILLCIVNGRILIHLNCFENKEVVFPKVKEIQIHSEYRYLFSIDSTKYFLCDMRLEDNQIPSEYGYVEERSLRIEGIGPKDNLFAAITGKHLADWYRDTKFCGRCGHKMVHSTKERAMVCPECHNTVYPRIMPAIANVFYAPLARQGKHLASYFKYLINHLSIYPYTHWCAVCRIIISTPANQYIIYLFYELLMEKIAGNYGTEE